MRTRSIVLMVAGLAVLLWGMASLQRIFLRERDDAIASLEGRRQALEQYARREAEQRLREELADAAADIDAAARDPLAPADGLYLSIGGRTVLPRPVRYREGTATPALDVLAALSAGGTPDAEPDDPWAERLASFRRFRAAVERDDTRAIESVFREILLHRSRFVLSASKDVPYMIALCELFFAAKSRPDRDLLRRIVRDGFGDPGTPGHVPGLQRQLLERRDKLTRPDFDGIAKRLVALSAALEARHDDFEDAAFGEPETPPRVPEDLAAPAVLARAWYVERTGPDRTEGVRVETADLLRAITVEMRDRGLLESDGQVALSPPRADAETIAALPVAPSTGSWARERAEIGSRYRLKSALGILLGVLAAGVAALAFLLQERERRFLALKSDFVSTVSHELRTPLAAVRLLAETLEKKAAGLAEVRDYPSRIVQEVDSLSFLVENILSFHRLEKGKVTPRIADVPLAEVVETVRAEAPLRASVPVDVRADGVDGVVLAADPELLKLLFLNLTSNACKHNDRTPVEIAISVRRGGGGRIAVDFRDNGRGIAESERDAVFEDFRRGSGSTGTRGFGLGLPICRRILRLHGGEIRVADSSPEGTRFELSLPAREGRV